MAQVLAGVLARDLPYPFQESRGDREMSKLHLSLSYDYPKALQRAIQLFTEETGIQVDVEVLEHQERSLLTNFAIRQTGPDISEVGSTWLSNLVSMAAIRPFSDSDVLKVGGQAAFVKGNWETGIYNNQIHSIPWRGDVRVINYRRDLLAKAGVDEKSAFSSLENLRDTVRKLQKLEDVVPWAMNTAMDSMLIHVIAPWIWNAGGHLISRDGHRTMFSEPEALAGICAFFDTFAPAISPDARDMPDSEASTQFLEGKAAAIISGHWITDIVHRQVSDPVMRENLGVVLTPGTQYSGGMNLVIWEHSRRTSDALELVCFLTRPDVQAQYLPEAGLLPVNKEALMQPPYTTDANYKVLKKSLVSGRHLTAVYMWGLVEDQLVAGLHSIWQTLFDDPQANLEQVVGARLKALAERLDHTLSFR
jgi:multiple sugar transport system substrate-binding protein